MITIKNLHLNLRDKFKSFLICSYGPHKISLWTTNGPRATLWTPLHYSIATIYNFIVLMFWYFHFLLLSDLSEPNSKPPSVKLFISSENKRRRRWISVRSSLSFPTWEVWAAAHLRGKRVGSDEERWEAQSGKESGSLRGSFHLRGVKKQSWNPKPDRICRETICGHLIVQNFNKSTDWTISSVKCCFRETISIFVSLEDLRKKTKN